MFRTHKIRLYPNNKQETLFKKSCGVSRFTYNWALTEWKTQCKNKEKPNVYKLCKQFNSIKKKQFPWICEVNKSVPQNAIKNLGTAYKNTFLKIKLAKAAKKKAKFGFPIFKKKGKHDSFRADNGTSKAMPNAIFIKNDKISIYRIGHIKMSQKLRFNGKIISAVVSRTADQWFVALSVDTTDSLQRKSNKGAVGVDLGIKTFATLSNSEVVVGPKALKTNLKKLRRLNKSLSRKTKGSANFSKAKTKLAKLHLRISNIRNDSLHKLTNHISTNFNLIGIEDLNVKGMAKNRNLASSISDMGFYEFKRQLLYKSEMTNTKVVIADRWFPSTKLCCKCKKEHEMPLTKRVMKCYDCGNEIDRDLNASINLMNYAVDSTVKACGETSSGIDNIVDTKLVSLKQELSFEFE